MPGDVFSQGVAQLNLFDDNAPRAGSAKLMEVLDHLNAKDGKGKLYRKFPASNMPLMPFMEK